MQCCPAQHLIKVTNLHRKEKQPVFSSVRHALKTQKLRPYLFIDGNWSVAETDALAEALSPPSPCFVVTEGNIVTMCVVELQGAVRSQGGQISCYTWNTEVEQRDHAYY